MEKCETHELARMAESARSIFSRGLDLDRRASQKAVVRHALPSSEHFKNTHCLVKLHDVVAARVASFPVGVLPTGSTPRDIPWWSASILGKGVDTSKNKVPDMYLAGASVS